MSEATDATESTELKLTVPTPEASNGHGRPHDPPTGEQIIAKGKIKPNGQGSEIITFVIDLERVNPNTKKLVCIVNIPDQDQDRAPVYIKQTAK